MEKLVITGGKRLQGKVQISGAKNAAVAILFSVALCDEVCQIENVPNIKDIHFICKILDEMGAKIRVINKNIIEIDPRKINTTAAPYELVRKMRASCYLLGVLLGRFGKAEVGMPGGCDFGTRPIDQHLKGFEALGAKYSLDSGVVTLECEKLVGNNVYLDIVSVGATINIMIAAVKAEGVTIIENAAKEPHVVDVANFLNCMGADIFGAGTDVIKIRGVKKLSGVNYSIIPDQIEAGTYMSIAGATGGDITIEGVIPKHLESITAKLSEIGLNIEEFDESIRVWCDKPLKKCNVKTMPHPGFPTDMQPQITSLLIKAEGTSMVNEAVYDNRFKYVEELRVMGAKITVDGRVAIIEGVKKLMGATVKASDLRAGAALIIAALAAEKMTIIEGLKYIERGYEDIVEKLSQLGADIKKISETQEETVALEA